MRVFFFSILGIPILIFDGILLHGLPAQLASLHTREEGWILLGGAALYLLVHVFLRKPERMYLWAHEFSHLIVAKIFFREIHSFHITSKDGGKVVMDRTNVMIDLAPYMFPLYCLTACAAASLFKGVSAWVPDLYLVLAAYLFSMHVIFSAEGFLKGQPDVKRSGRLFSGAIVLLFLLLWIPCLLAPGAASGWKGAAAFYGGWFQSAPLTIRRLFLFAASIF
ncbi:MAG TPA: M50 family metallopeptidase [Candidatus Deferrimicrobiaceae bacterium]